MSLALVGSFLVLRGIIGDVLFISHPGKETDGRRLTYLLRSNSIRPVSSSLDTPPATDASDFHVSDVNTSDSNTTDGPDDSASEDESVAIDPFQAVLSAISEFPSPSRPSSLISSVSGGPDLAIDSAEEGDVDPALTASIESLSLAGSFHHGSDTTAFVVDRGTPPSEISLVDSTVPVRPSARYFRPRPYPRSTSSPSPVRRTSHRMGRFGRHGKDKTTKKPVIAVGGKGLFYDYLFA